MNTRRVQHIVLGLAAAILAVVGLRLWPRIAAQAGGGPTPASAPAMTMLLPRVCDPAAHTCTHTLPDGARITFTLAPAPIRPLQTLHVTVTLAGMRAERVDVVLEGVQMPMGMAPVRLLAHPDASDAPEAPNPPVARFGGQAILPLCTTGAMQWSAAVRLKRGNHTLIAPFHFDVAAR